MVSAKMPRDPPGVVQLAVVIFLKADGEGLHWLRHHLAHQADHDA